VTSPAQPGDLSDGGLPGDAARRGAGEARLPDDAARRGAGEARLPDDAARPGDLALLGPPRVVPPGELGVPADAAMPLGMPVELEPDTQQLTGDVLFGGSPARVLRLSPAGVRALAELRAGPVASAASATLARKLTDTGMASPRPPRPGPAMPGLSGPAPGPAVPGPAVPGPAAPGPAASGGAVAGLATAGPAAPGLAVPHFTGADVTVVVPVRDRARELDRCLAAAGTEYPVVVVDDASAHPDAVAAVCAARGARLIRRAVNGGPGPARNTALAEISTPFVAFLDSDCVPSPGWIGGLAGHFADPLVAAVAPRIAAQMTDPKLDIGSPLDLGDRPARVLPMTRVAYVPTAALLVRRAVLGGGFDETLRYGEDVDLVWRLAEGGWRIRYEPGVRVAHAEPVTRPELLRRRFRYGNSAAPLMRRHPGAVAPLVLQPWPTITVAALLGRRPLTAGVAFALSTGLLARRLRANGLPAEHLARPMANGVYQTWLGTGRWCGQFAGPALLLALARPGGRGARTRWGRRAAVASLLVGPPVAQWARDRRGDPLRFTAETLADQAAYGAGVWVGCARERLFTPVLPAVSWQPFRGLRARRATVPDHDQEQPQPE
jgi:mycofactocin glycosyltransferase